MKPLRQLLRRPGKYAQAVLRWRQLSFHDAPPIFGNSKPKSGSHLLLQILNGLTRIMPYKYVEVDPIGTIEKKGRRRTAEETLHDLKRIPRGVIGWGYVEPTPGNVAFLCQPHRINYFMYRDPRDMLISQVFFATDMHEEHGMHDFYRSLPDFGARLNFAITGIDRDGLYMVNVRQRYASVLEWLEQPHVMCIRFEDVINKRESTLESILDEIESIGYKIPTPRPKALSTLVEAIQPKKSRTFRSGKTGGWREHFTDEHKELFKDVAGDLLVRLGYEKDNNW
mgnify:FL=1